MRLVDSQKLMSSVNRKTFITGRSILVVSISVNLSLATPSTKPLGGRRLLFRLFLFVLHGARGSVVQEGLMVTAKVTTTTKIVVHQTGITHASKATQTIVKTNIAAASKRQTSIQTHIVKGKGHVNHLGILGMRVAIIAIGIHQIRIVVTMIHRSSF